MTLSSNTSGVLRQRLRWLLFILLIFLGLAIAWRWSPLQHWLDIDVMVRGLQRLGHSLGPMAAVGGFALAVSLAIPLTVMTLITLIAFGPWVGLACCVAGALVSASLSYSIGHFLGREVLERFAGERVNLLSRRLSKRGVLTIIILRMMPIAPFAIVNMMTGASHIRLRDVLLGTAIGMTPATLVMMIFIPEVRQ